MAKETIQIRLEPSDLEWLDKEVRRQGSSRGAVIRSLIRARKDTELPPVSEANCKRRKGV
ncbi:ribbon-helix-helix protein, CopG family [uncultured Pyramidobacter sp.]|uniref:ribbon-helix-helix protein, CopG family n=1 Tax=uncultured Pyramidobacter sp. TaxID=1623495 RepID=UPI00258E720A|nr:ribbon-helix-helix protein, CopG family [uncultured Pyramidobacter sp.]